MSDIQLRFDLDMLVLSTPVERQLESLGLDSQRDNELMLLLEPEVLGDLYALEAAAGVQCLVTDTAHFTPARLAHSATPQHAVEGLARAAVDVVAQQDPQHILVEIGPCGLPLDASSAASLNESRSQYERSASMFSDLEDSFDAYFLNGFESCTDLKCALMGIRKKTDKPVFASVSIAASGIPSSQDAIARQEAVAHDGSSLTLGGLGRETLAEAIGVMTEYGAQVAGFATSCGPLPASRIASEARSLTALPLLVQLDVLQVDPEQGSPTSDNPYFEPDQMVPAADLLRNAGAQFLRAVGNATPSYAGALVSATMGERVVGAMPQEEASSQSDEDLAEIAEALRDRVSKALGDSISSFE